MSFLEIGNSISTVPLLRVQDLHVHYRQSRQTTVAVDGVSFDLNEGETLGLVGESGCGKSSLGRAIVRLENIHAGKILFKGRDIGTLRSDSLKDFRRHAQMIFQDPYGSLNPRMTVGAALDEVLNVHRLGNPDERRRKTVELMQAVGLEPSYLKRYPHEFSGGQRQRIGIARSVALQPELIVADEPVSALDVSIQVQILNLLKDLQARMSLAYLFIAHDLAVVRYVCDRVMVMYLGRIVESAPASQLYDHPSHPYTAALMEAVPDIDRGLRERRMDGGRRVSSRDAASPVRPASGCAFHPRCPLAQDRCRHEAPRLREVKPGQFSACHFAEEVRVQGLKSGRGC